MLLIITACVKPEDTISLKLKSFDERLRQYVDGLNFFIEKQFFDKIIFCDNSAFEYDYQNLIDKANSNNIKLEILQFKGDFETVKKQGKGYGEGELIEYIFNHSNLIKNEEYFFKITGRLKIENFDKINKVIDLTNNYFNISVLKRFGIIDTRFYGVKVCDYKKALLSSYKNVDDDNFNYLEMCFQDSLALHNIDFKCFPVYPQITGISGTKNKPYKDFGILYAYKKVASHFGFLNTKISSLIMYIMILPSSILRKFRMLFSH